MTAKEYLGQGYQLARGVRFKRARILALRELAGGTGAAYTGNRVGASPACSRLENCICQIDEWEREIDADIEKLRAVRTYLARVENLDYRHLLELRYVDGFTWDQIARKMNYSERHIYNLHGRALKECSKLQSVS